MMHEISHFPTDNDYLNTSKALDALVDTGVLDTLEPDSAGPFVLRRFVAHGSGEMWALAIPDQAFRGYLRREGFMGVPKAG